MKRNAKSLFAKECMFDALMNLMEEKNYHEISVTEITKKAGFSRMAYYRNYNTKEDILVDHIDDQSQKILSYFQTHKDNSDNFQFLVLFFAVFRSQKRLLHNLIKSDISYFLLKNFKKNASDMMDDFSKYTNKDSVQPDPYKAHFIAGGLFEVVLEWSKQAMQESDEEMARRMLRYFSL